MARMNTICHVEWRSNDVERLKNFYTSVFDWKLKDPMPGYTLVDTGNEGLGGGMMQIPTEQTDGMALGKGVTNYVLVEDLAPYEEKIRAAGGQVVFSGMEVPGVGWFSGFTDPDGNLVAMWKTVNPPKPPEAEKKKRKKDKKRAKKAAKKAAQKAKKKAKKKKKKAKKK